MKALVLTIPWQIIEAVPPRLLFVGFTVAQPFLLFRVVDAVKDGEVSEISNGLIGATAIIFIGVAVRFRFLHSHIRFSWPETYSVNIFLSLGYAWSLWTVNISNDDCDSRNTSRCDLRQNVSTSSRSTEEVSSRQLDDNRHIGSGTDHLARI